MFSLAGRLVLTWFFGHSGYQGITWSDFGKFYVSAEFGSLMRGKLHIPPVAAAGQAIWLDSLNAAPVGGLAVWTMANSGGIIPGNTNAANDTVVESTRTGQHTLTVSGSLTTTTGSLRFQVHFPVDTGGPIAPASTLAAATPVPVPITQPGMNARFTFDVSGTDLCQGRVIAAQLVVSPWTIVAPGFSILGPGGVPLFSGTLTATTIVTGRLTAAGQYTVLINPSLVSTGSGSLKVAVTPIDLVRQIVPGSSLGGAPVIRTGMNEVGQDLRFTFDVSGTDVGQGRVIAAQLVVSPWTIVASGFQILGPGGALLTQWCVDGDDNPDRSSDCLRSVHGADQSCRGQYG